MNGFQKELYAKLHAQGFLVTQNIMPDNEDFNAKELAKNNDYIFLMAYDQHWGESVPGAISDQKWIEKETDEITRKIPAAKLVLGVAGFGYDWPDGEEGVGRAQARRLVGRIISLPALDVVGLAPVHSSPCTKIQAG